MYQTRTIKFKNKIEDAGYLNLLNEVVKKTGGYVSGGCFKDMFYYKTPRDLDIYFRTKYDLEHAIKVFEDEEYTKAYENENCVAFAFPYTKDENSITQVFILEFVKSKIGNPEDVMDTFDFSINRISYDGTEFLSYFDSYNHLIKKQIKIINYNNPIGNLQRVIKYSGYGFKIGNNELVKLLYEIAKQSWPHILNLPAFFNSQLKKGYRYDDIG